MLRATGGHVAEPVGCIFTNLPPLRYDSDTQLSAGHTEYPSPEGFWVVGLPRPPAKGTGNDGVEGGPTMPWATTHSAAVSNSQSSGERLLPTGLGHTSSGRRFWVAVAAGTDTMGRGAAWKETGPIGPGGSPGRHGQEAGPLRSSTGSKLERVPRGGVHNLQGGVSRRVK